MSRVTKRTPNVTGKGVLNLVQNPLVKGVLNQGVMSGGLRPPILKFSFQVGDV